MRPQITSTVCPDSRAFATQQRSVPASGRTIGSNGGIGADVSAGPALVAWPKSWVIQIEPSALQNTPIPTRLNPGARMFSRCPSECIHALWSEPSYVPALPAAMFSPTKLYGPSRLEIALWRKPFEAMFALHERAYVASDGSHASPGRPRAARSWLRRTRRSFSICPVFVAV